MKSESSEEKEQTSGLQGAKKKERKGRACHMRPARMIAAGGEKRVSSASTAAEGPNLDPKQSPVKAGNVQNG